MRVGCRGDVDVSVAMSVAGRDSVADEMASPTDKKFPRNITSKSQFVNNFNISTDLLLEVTRILKYKSR